MYNCIGTWKTIAKMCNVCVVRSQDSPGLGTHLFVKVPRPGDSEVTFSVLESSGNSVKYLSQGHNKPIFTLSFFLC